MPIPDIVSVAHAKAHLSELLKEVARGKVYEVINHSHPEAILLSVEQYKALLEKIEDLEDGIAYLEGKLESQGQPTVPWEQVKQEYWAEHPEEARAVSD